MLLTKIKTNSGKKLLNNKGILISSLVVLSAVVSLILIRKQSGKQVIVDNYWKGEIISFCVNNSCFDKQGDNWWLKTNDETVPAINDKVNDLSKRMGQIKLEDIASVNSENFGNFGIDGKIILNSNGRKLEIGNFNSNLDGTFVKIPDENTVYRINAIVDKNSLTDMTGWKNKQVLNLKAEDIKSAILNGAKGNTTINLVRNKNWLDKLVNLTGSDVTSKLDDTGVGFVFTITTNNDQSIKILVGNNWVTTDSKFFYTIDKTTHDWLTRIVK
jgi:hypothetical protein